MSYSLINDSSVLDIRNAHLRVAGNVEAQAIKVGAVELNAGYSLERTANVGNTTSNTIQFTNEDTSFITSGNVNIGKNLNILYTDNVATIEANSNVVTEFSRSKKLIKYPRVALTQNALNNGYTVSANAEESAGRAVWKLFDNTGNATAWRSEANGDYNASGAYTGSANLGSDSGGTAFADADKGDWVKIQLPHKIKLDHFTLQVRYSPSIPPGSSISYGRSEFIKNGKVWGSNDGTSWSLVHTISGTSAPSDTAINTYTVTSSIYYRYFGLVITDTNATVTGLGTSLSEIELYGIPEYDPDADGVDVKVTSYPNVPNTDWLEVYYDAKDLADGAVTSVDDLTPNGTNDGTATNVTVSDEAFVFDGTSDIRSTVSTFTGDQPHTMSVWVNIPTSHTLSDGYICVLAPSTGENTNQVSTIRYKNDGFNLQSWGNDIQMYNIGVEKGRWYHLVAVYDGGGVTTSSKRLYIDTVQNTKISSDSTTGDEINFANTTLSLGSRVDGNSVHLTGSIANFRLFNRALTQDEIWQLYAYQKEYFGHGDLSMTLKAGRLGIGTSEPRAALDVRGDLRVDGHTQLETLAPRYYSSMQRGTFHNVSSHIITGFDHQAEGYATPALGWEVHINFNHHRNMATHVEIDGGYLSTAPTTHVAISEVATRKYDEDTSAFSFYSDRFYIGSDIANAHAAAYAVIRITNSQVPGMQSAIHAGNSSTVRYHMLGHTMYVKPGIGSCLDVAIGKISGGDNARLHGIRVATGADNITGSYTVYTYH